MTSPPIGAPPLVAAPPEDNPALAAAPGDEPGHGAPPDGDRAGAAQEADAQPASSEPAGDTAPAGQPVAGGAAEEFVVASPVPRGTAERLYGFTFERVETHGPAAFGDGATAVTNIYQAARQDRASTGRRLDAPERVATYAPAPVDDRLDRLLRSQHAVCLTGAKGTGRFTTACAALARRHGADRVHEIHLPPGGRTESLLQQPLLPVAGAGHVFHLPSGVTATLIRSLDGIFRQRRATLVMIRDAGPTSGEPANVEAHHRRADPVQIFRRHLDHRLRGTCIGGCAAECDAECVQAYVAELCRHGGVLAALRKAYRPREIVDLAQSFARKRLRGPDIDEAVNASAPERRLRAAQVLLPGEADGTFRHQRVTQYERAFRIAYAVFDQHPLECVFHSTGLLLNELDDDSGRPQLGRLPLEHSVQILLGDVLGGDWIDASDAAPAAGGSSRAARLRDGLMAGAILDVAWHELDNTRPALLRWLKALAQDDDLSITQRAAEVAGLLTSFDFDIVHRRLINEWAASARPHLRQVAARAVTIAASGEEVAERVFSEVRAWALAGSAYHRDTAVRFHAGGLRRLQPALFGQPGWVLVDLRRVAEDPMQRPYHTIAQAVSELYVPAESGTVLGELAGWARGPHAGVQLHAARSFSRIARRWSTRDGRYDLLTHAVDRVIDGSDLAALWSVALLSPATAAGAWELLGEWLRQADGADGPTEVMARLLRTLASQPPTKRRLDFYLPRIWNPGQYTADPPAWVRSAVGKV
ncbi:MAG TPA: hypothetical protein VES42_25895 [Pilimelia sp.]|nr:hypothetical protein [Pilimelia sp.]